MSKLYWLSIITYIGGGFSNGIHNIMEPAVASNPIIFGPNHKKFSEADIVIKLGGGFAYIIEMLLKVKLKCYYRIDSY